MRLSRIMPATVQVGRSSVRQEWKRQMQPLGGFALIIRILGREAENVDNAERFELGEMVAETARLRRAAAGAGNIVPPWRKVDSGNAGARIDIQNGAAAELRHIEGAD